MSGSASTHPDRIDRYEIEGVAAEGAMGVVYRAHDPRMKRTVAVKLLKARAAQTEDGRRRFESEAEAIAAVEHPAIVPLYDYGKVDERPFLVMRWLPGGTLEDRMAAGPMSLRDVSTVLERVCAALDLVHEHGIVHRDVKPANILFDAAGDAYLSDFGIVKIESDVESTGYMLLGTPKYMSPEQAQSRPLDRRSDVYSLAAVAFHALTGEGPFVAESPLAMAMAHVCAEPTKVRALRPDLPEIIDAVFDRALAKDATRRHATAGDFARDLRDLAAGRWYLVKVAEALEGRAVAPAPVPTRRPPSGPSTAADPSSQTIDVDPRTYRPDDLCLDDRDD